MNKRVDKAKAIWGKVWERLKKISKKIYIAAAAALVVLAVILVIVLNNKPYSALVTGVSMDEMSSVLQLLASWGLREYKVSANPGGIAVSGETTLIGMWNNSGIYIMIGQSSFGFEELVIYREVKHIKDYSGGSNRFLPRDALKTMSYSRLLNEFRTLRKEGNAYERAA